MSPLLLVTVLVVALVALLPVWRLHAAAWPVRWLVVAWLGYTVAILVAVRVPGTTRFLVPMLVLAFAIPFVAGPERLSRVVRVRRIEPRTIVDVTPRPPAALPTPTEDDAATDSSPLDDHR